MHQAGGWGSLRVESSPLAACRSTVIPRPGRFLPPVPTVPRWQRGIVRAVSPRAASTTLDVDLAGVEQPNVNDLLALAARCDAFLLGHMEVAQLWPGEAPRSVLRLMAHAGVRAAVVKLGAGGS